jgi:hypothetical protein
MMQDMCIPCDRKIYNAVRSPTAAASYPVDVLRDVDAAFVSSMRSAVETATSAVRGSLHDAIMDRAGEL